MSPIMHDEPAGSAGGITELDREMINQAPRCGLFYSSSRARTGGSVPIPYPRGRGFRANTCDFLRRHIRLTQLCGGCLLRSYYRHGTVLQQDALHDRPGTAGAAPRGAPVPGGAPCGAGPQLIARGAAVAAVRGFCLTSSRGVAPQGCRRQHQVRPSHSE
jgi:hypothetical protein